MVSTHLKKIGQNGNLLQVGGGQKTYLKPQPRFSFLTGTPPPPPASLTVRPLNGRTGPQKERIVFQASFLSWSMICFLRILSQVEIDNSWSWSVFNGGQTRGKLVVGFFQDWSNLSCFIYKMTTLLASSAKWLQKTTRPRNTPSIEFVLPLEFHYLCFMCLMWHTYRKTPVQSLGAFGIR